MVGQAGVAPAFPCSQGTDLHSFDLCPNENGGYDGYYLRSIRFDKPAAPLFAFVSEILGTGGIAPLVDFWPSNDGGFTDRWPGQFPC